MNPPPAAAKSATAVVLLLCIAASFCIYYPALRNGFYGEDSLFLSTARTALDAPRVIFQNNYEYFRPVWFAYVTILFKFFQYEPAGYFAVGIALHGLAGFLVYGLARRLLASSAAAISAAAFFLVTFSHSEALLWFAAHNTILAAILSVFACSLQIDAIREKSWSKMLAAAGAGAGCILAKDTGLIHLTFVGLLAFTFGGFSSLKNIKNYVLAVILLIAFATYVWMTPAFTRFLSGNGAVADAGAGSRLGFSNLTITRVLGSLAWLFDPRNHDYNDLSLTAGLAAPAAILGIVYFTAREHLRAVFVAFGLAIFALLPVCISARQTPTGVRHYYLVNIGVAIAAAALLDALGRIFIKNRSASPFARALPRALILSIFAGASIINIRDYEHREYGPLTRAETEAARALRPFLGGEPRPLVYLLNSPLSNIMHAQGFLLLFFFIPEQQVARAYVERKDAESWYSYIQQNEKEALILEWSDGKWREVRDAAQLQQIFDGDPDSAVTAVRIVNSR